MLIALNSRCWLESVMLSLRHKNFGRCFAGEIDVILYATCVTMDWVLEKWAQKIICRKGGLWNVGRCLSMLWLAMLPVRPYIHE